MVPLPINMVGKMLKKDYLNVRDEMDYIVLFYRLDISHDIDSIKDIIYGLLKNQL